MATELQKLSTEEDAKLNIFVGKAVRKNLSFPVLDTRLMNKNSLTVQDMFNANVLTLQAIGKSLRRMQADFDPEFSSTESQKVGTIDIAELVEVVKLIIKEKNFKTAASNIRKHKAELSAKIAELRTPQELREIAEKELQAMPQDSELEEA